MKRPSTPAEARRERLVVRLREVEDKLGRLWPDLNGDNAEAQAPVHDALEKVQYALNLMGEEPRWPR